MIHDVERKATTKTADGNTGRGKTQRGRQGKKTGGMTLWGAGGARRILQVAYADDWAGVFASERELRRTWMLWQAWTLASGCRLGIDGVDKTTVTAVRYLEDGSPVNGRVRALYTHDGRRVPQLDAFACYRHLGVRRRADGRVCDAVAAMRSAWPGHMASLRAFRLRPSGRVSGGV